MHGMQPKKFSMLALSRISERHSLPLSDELGFYRKLSDKCGDFQAGFIEKEKNTARNSISIEHNEQTIVFLGNKALKRTEDLHQAVWMVIMLLEVFKVKPDDDIKNLYAYFGAVFGWSWAPKHSKRVASLL